MPSAASIMSELKKKGSAQTQKTYARHGMAPEHTFGVSIADLQRIAKTDQRSTVAGLRTL